MINWAKMFHVRDRDLVELQDARCSDSTSHSEQAYAANKNNKTSQEARKDDRIHNKELQSRKVSFQKVKYDYSPVLGKTILYSVPHCGQLTVPPLLPFCFSSSHRCKQA